MRLLVLVAALAAATSPWAMAQPRPASPSPKSGGTFGSKLAPYVASPSHIVDLMLDVAKVHPGDVVYDLGSGDGRVLIAAANLHAQAVGIEINPKLVAAATESISLAGLSERAKVIQGDVMTADFSPATVVTLYMDETSNGKLRPQLEKLLKPGARVVSYDAIIPGWKPSNIFRVEQGQRHTIYLYEIGAKK